MPHQIPYSKQTIEDDDIKAVSDVLKSDWITNGPKVEEFENNLAQYCGSKYAVAFSNGTTALHAACLALGINKNHNGITTPITFAATANCLRYVGSNVKFADVTEGLPLLDPKNLEEKINSKTKIIIPVHFSGAVCDMKAIHQIAKKNNLFILEDACHALGAKDVGNCKYSDLTAFSFHPVKSITTGEGGALTTNNFGLYQKLKKIRHHGIEKPKNKPGWYYEIKEIGFNFRMTEMQAALGISQLKKLDHFIKLRKQKFEVYKEALKNKDGVKLLEPRDGNSSHHLALILLDKKYSRDDLYNYLKEQNIHTQFHYMPLYRHPAYKNKRDEKKFPNAERYFKSALSIPLYPTLSASDQSFVIEKILSWKAKQK